MLSNAPVLDIEDPADWDAYLQGVLASLAPEGYLETTIAHRVATLLWRMARVVRYETEMISTGMDYRATLASTGVDSRFNDSR